MKLWIVKDKRGKVKLFKKKPISICTIFYSLEDMFGMTLKPTNNNSTFLEQVTFENSPQEVELELLGK